MTHGNTMKILVVEDDRTTGQYITRGLREEGHTVDLVDNGRDGLVHATSADHDVLIVDRMLPEIDGLTLVKSLRGAGNRTPVLMLTAMGSVDWLNPLPLANYRRGSTPWAAARVRWRWM
jgi:two-component system OmpR family response regulator